MEPSDDRERLTRLEAHEVATREVLAKLGNSIDELRAEIHRSQRTPWPLMLSSAAIVLSLVGAGGTLISKDVARVEHDLRSYVEAASSDRFTGTEGRALAEKVADQREILELEMRLATAECKGPGG